jgi:hypothetical protein
MVDKAIKSLHTLFFASLLILALWLLSWPASGEKLRLYRAAIDLHAWVNMKERLSNLKIDVFEADPSGDITHDVEEGKPKATNYESYDLPVPLQLSVTWPMQRTEGFHLTPAGFSQKTLTVSGASARVYRIVADSTQLPLSDYYAIFLIDTETVWEEGNVLDRERRRVGLVPTDYRLFGVRDPGIRQVTSGLSSRDGALVRLQAEVDPRLPSGGVNIFGAPLTVAQFFSAVGILLAAVSFAMIGPLLALRSSPVRKNSQAWVFVIPQSEGGPRRLLEWMICAVTILWALSPILILLLQVTVYAHLDTVAGWLFWLGAIGLAVSSVTYSLVAWELRVTRLTSGLSA